MNVFTENIRPGSEVVAEILDAKGKIVGTTKVGAAGRADSFFLKTKVNKPLQWTAETPNLYRVHVSIKNAGKTIYQTSQKFGFRTIEIRKQDGIYVNGVKIKMKGVNRHVWWPETGRSVSPEIDLNDVKLIK
jgi:beta-galactosidase/beta-glucuronidase